MWQVSNNGLVLQDTAELLAEVQQVFTDIWSDINLDASTPQGMIITKLTDKLAEAQGKLVELANVYFQGGSGIWLDIRNQSLFGITRRLATTNSVDIKITGVPYYLVQAGTQVSDSDGNNVFTLQNSISILSTGEVIATFYNDTDNFQNIAIGLGDLDTLVGTNANIQKVENVSYIAKSRETESDGDFLQRAEASKYQRADSITSAGLAYVRQIEGVTRAEIYENYTNLQESYKNEVMPPHSINYVVEGGDVQAVAQGILYKKNPGCAFGGDTTIDVVDSVSAQTYKVSFHRPFYTELYMTATIKQQLYDNLNYQDVLYEQIYNYIQNLAIGEDVYATKIVNSLNIDFILRSLQIYDNSGKSGDGVAITSDFTECYNLQKDNIQIVLV